MKASFMKASGMGEPATRAPRKTAPHERLTIGRVAKLSGVGVETLRYYQRIGILEEPTRPASGARSYPLEAVRKVRFIRRAQTLGFRLKEIEELFVLGATKPSHLSSTLGS